MNPTKAIRPANDNGSSAAESPLELLLPLIDVLARQAVRQALAANDNCRDGGSADLD